MSLRRHFKISTVDLPPLASSLALAASVGLCLLFINPDGAVVNIDLILVQSLIMLHKSVRASIYFGCIIVMFVDSLANQFMFDLIPFVRQIEDVSLDLIAANIITLVVAALFAGLAALLSAKLPPSRLFPTLVLVVLILLIDAAQGSLSVLRFGESSHPLGRFDVAYSELNRVRVQLHRSTPTLNVNQIAPAQSAASQLLISNEPHKVLVIVESLGIERAQANRPDWGYRDIFRRHPGLVVKRRGTVTAYGGTVSGELRELCNLQVRAVAPLNNYQHCMPWQLKARGFSTYAVHSYRGSMFDRRTWWPRAGFDRTVFKDDRIGLYQSCPRTLNSLCDAEMLQGELERAFRTKKSFLYFLSSNSHLPAPAGLTVQDMLHQALDGILSAVEKASTPLAPNSVEIIVVGDHPPPLMGFGPQRYVSATVPYWVVAPREGETPRSGSSAAPAAH